jgi:HNH endonuclease/AP2 domain
MREISVEYLREALSYDPETGVLRWLHRPRSHFPSDRGFAAWNARHAGRVVSSRDTRGYYRLTIRFMGKSYHSCRAHRLAWALATGKWPVNEIDHIDGDPGNNKLSNLRAGTHAENGQNQKLRSTNTNTTGFMGVTWDFRRRKWAAQIVAGGRQYNLGRFDAPEKASAAYTAAKAIHHSFSPISRPLHTAMGGRS